MIRFDKIDIKPYIEKLKKLLPNSQDDPDKRLIKIFIFVASGTVFFMLLVGLLTFFITLKGAEVTMVPDLEGMPLENALIELQDRGLYPRIQLRYSDEPSDKGKVTGQSEKAGTSIKSGRTITLRVSKGAIIDKVENYVGWKFNDLEIHLHALFTTYGPVLKIKKPVIYVNSEAASGTILEQKPVPGTEITSLTELSLVVSKGNIGSLISVPNFIGQPWDKAIEKLDSLNTPFEFSVRKAKSGEQNGIIISQTPSADTQADSDSLIKLEMTEPYIYSDRYIFGVIKDSIQNFDVSVKLKLTAQRPTGDIVELFDVNSVGGQISIPYLEEENTVLTLYIEDRKQLTHVVRSSKGF